MDANETAWALKALLDWQAELGADAAIAGLLIAPFAVVMAGIDSVFVLGGFMFVAFGFLGLVLPSTGVLAMEEQGDIAGSASALMGTVQMIAASVVTRKPPMNFASRPAFSMAAEIALPPPWTTIGWMPATSKNTMSRMTLATRSGSSMAEPPILMRKVFPRNAWR